MVYDEGFNLEFEDFSFFTFFKYSIGLEKNNVEFKSYCHSTLTGWYNNKDKSNWGCFKANKIDINQIDLNKPSFIRIKNNFQNDDHYENNIIKYNKITSPSFGASDFQTTSLINGNAVLEHSISYPVPIMPISGVPHSIHHEPISPLISRTILNKEITSHLPIQPLTLHGLTTKRFNTVPRHIVFKKPQPAFIVSPHNLDFRPRLLTGIKRPLDEYKAPKNSIIFAPNIYNFKQLSEINIKNTIEKKFKNTQKIEYNKNKKKEKKKSEIDASYISNSLKDDFRNYTNFIKEERGKKGIKSRVRNDNNNYSLKAINKIFSNENNLYYLSIPDSYQLVEKFIASIGNNPAGTINNKFKFSSSDSKVNTTCNNHSWLYIKNANQTNYTKANPQIKIPIENKFQKINNLLLNLNVIQNLNKHNKSWEVGIYRDFAYNFNFKKYFKNQNDNLNLLNHQNNLNTTDIHSTSFTKNRLRSYNKWNGKTSLISDDRKYENFRFKSQSKHKLKKQILEIPNLPSEQIQKIKLFPKDFDWMDLLRPAAKQGNCGSCYVISSLRMAEARLKLLYNHNVELSVQHVLDCSYYNQGCDGGYGFLVMKFANEFELIPESCKPYTVINHLL